MADDSNNRTTRQVPDQTESTKTLSQTLEGHAALVFSGVLVFVTAIRLLRVAHGSPSTAFAVVQATGTGNVLVGLIVSILPVLTYIVSMVICFVAIWHRRPLSYLLVPVAAGLLFLSVFLILVLIIAVIVSIAPLFLRSSTRTRLRSRDAAARTERARRVRRICTFAIVMLGLLATHLLVATDYVWLPSETILVEGETEAITGYLLSSDADSTVILREVDRKVLIFETPVESREICSLRGLQGFYFPPADWKDETLPSLLNGNDIEPVYERCPT